jgi:hypothetical protein
MLDGYLVPREADFFFDGAEEESGQYAPNIAAKFRVRDGIPECVSFCVTVKPGGRGIRDCDLALFNLESLTRNVLLSHAQKAIESQVPMRELDQMRASNAIANASAAARIKRVARVYLENASTGAPRMAVADSFGFDPRHASRLIADARLAGLIPPLGASDEELASALEAIKQES